MIYKTTLRFAAVLFALSIWGYGCGGEEEEEGGEIAAGNRQDNATMVAISLDGSLQNPAWSPDGETLLITRFRNGYNEEPADLFMVEAGDGTATTLVSDGSGNVSLPGSAWNSVTEQIVFSSSRDPHDEIFIIDDGGVSGDEIQVTSRSGLVAYEPSLSPNGDWVVFETHVLDQEDNGVITRFRVDGTGEYVALTDPADDCRQPNWSPAGGKILYQRFDGSQWDLWTINEDGSQPTQITNGPGDKTDASFSPDGHWIVFSSDEGELDLANIFIISSMGSNTTRVTNWAGYDGAPSWSSNDQIAFESYPGDPDDSLGTSIWVIDVPATIPREL
ncbi:MAG: PD40 domain-containing protein [Deltaproteobacteria bacterium]|nr:PD40 domain-containing protein [Deltaproteobacteria bacterium]